MRFSLDRQRRPVDLDGVLELHPLHLLLLRRGAEADECPLGLDGVVGEELAAPCRYLKRSTGVVGTEAEEVEVCGDAAEADVRFHDDRRHLRIDGAVGLLPDLLHHLSDGGNHRLQARVLVERATGGDGQVRAEDLLVLRLRLNRLITSIELIAPGQPCASASFIQT